MKEKQDNEKREITERFVTALDFLVDSGKLKTVNEFEQKTGIRSQKITSLRGFLKGETRTGQYPSISDIKTIHDLFGVSYDFIFGGIKPIVKQEMSIVSDSAQPEYKNGTLMEVREEMAILREKVKLLNEKVDFYKEIITQKLS